MTDQQRRLFLNCVAEHGGTRAFRRNDCSVRDFIDNAAAQIVEPEVIAARVLSYFCLDGASFNRFMVGIQLAVSFLDRALKPNISATERGQALADLRQILASSPNEHSFVQWARSHWRT